MRQSPLYLNHYQLLDICIKPVEGYSHSGDAVYPDFAGAEYVSTVRFGVDENAEDPRDFVVQLDIKISPKEKKSFPYNIEMGIIGYFAVPKDIPSPQFDRNKFVNINGPALLYGAIREVILMTTSRFENGPVLIPTVTFIDSIQEKGD